MEAAGIDTEDCMYVGIRMLAIRANIELNDLNAHQKNSLRRASERDWSKLKDESKARSVNMSQSQKMNLKAQVIRAVHTPTTEEPTASQVSK